MGKAQRKVHRAMGVCSLMVAAGTLGVGGGRKMSGEKCKSPNYTAIYSVPKVREKTFKD